MSSFEGDQSTPSGPLGLLGTGAEPAVVGQVAMATDHGGWFSAPTGAAGQPLGRGTCRKEEDEGKGVSSGSMVPSGKEQGCEAKAGAPYGMQDVQSDWL